MEIRSLSSSNSLFDTIIGGTIHEYDIESAGSTAIRHLKGDKIYDELMLLDKKTRNITIGKMMLKERGLGKKVSGLMLEWLNLFMKKNNITQRSFIYNTRDSIVLYNKIPLKTKFGIVNFRDKDGMFSSLYKFKQFTVLFDSMTCKVVVKGIKDEFVETSAFFNEFLAKHLLIIENCQKSGDKILFRNLERMRTEYMHSSDFRIYGDVMNENKIPIRMGDEIFHIEGDMNAIGEDFVIIKENNYINFILPIMRAAQLNG